MPQLLEKPSIFLVARCIHSCHGSRCSDGCELAVESVEVLVLLLSLLVLSWESCAVVVVVCRFSWRIDRSICPKIVQLIIIILAQERVGWQQGPK